MGGLAGLERGVFKARDAPSGAEGSEGPLTRARGPRPLAPGDAAVQMARQGGAQAPRGVCLVFSRFTSSLSHSVKSVCPSL